MPLQFLRLLDIVDYGDFSSDISCRYLMGQPKKLLFLELLIGNLHYFVVGVCEDFDPVSGILIVVFVAL